MKTNIQKYGLVIVILGMVMMTAVSAVQNESNGGQGQGAGYNKSINARSAGVINHLKAIDKQIELAEKLVARLKNCSDTSNLTSLIVDIKTSRDKLVTAIENLNKTEFKSAKEDLRKKWVSLKQQMTRNIVVCRSQRLKNAVKKGENITNRLMNITNRLETKGGNVSAVNSAIKEAENLRKEAKELLDAGDVEGARAKFSEFKDKLKEILREIRNIIRGVKTKK